jgi:hypothetical protein
VSCGAQRPTGERASGLRIGELGEIESAAGERDRLSAGVGFMMWLFGTGGFAVIPQQPPSVSVTLSMTPMLAETDGAVHPPWGARPNAH